MAGLQRCLELMRDVLKATSKRATLDDRSTATRSFNFFGLPRELRDEILIHLLCQKSLDPVYLHRAASHRKASNFRLSWFTRASVRANTTYSSLLLANRQMHDEAQNALLGNVVCNIFNEELIITLRITQLRLTRSFTMYCHYTNAAFGLAFIVHAKRQDRDWKISVWLEYKYSRFPLPNEDARELIERERESVEQRALLVLQTCLSSSNEENEDAGRTLEWVREQIAKDRDERFAAERVTFNGPRPSRMDWEESDIWFI